MQRWGWAGGDKDDRQGKLQDAFSKFEQPLWLVKHKNTGYPSHAGLAELKLIFPCAELCHRSLTLSALIKLIRVLWICDQQSSEEAKSAFGVWSCPVLSHCPTEEFTALWSTWAGACWRAKAWAQSWLRLCAKITQKLVLSSRQKPKVEFQRCGVIGLCYISSKEAESTFLLRARAELDLAGTNLSAQLMGTH